jgi:hypothetical protein
MLLQTIASTLKNSRFWKWQIGGAIIYAVPAAIRLATGNVILPVLSLLAVPWIGHYIPGNLVEKILVNAFFPGAAGAVAGEVYFINIYGQPKSRKQKYLYRLHGALLWVALWSIFQLFGNLQGITGTWGSNLFEYPSVYPLNFVLASLSIFTPTILDFIKTKTIKILTKFYKKKG